MVRLVHDNGLAELKQAAPSLLRLILKARHWWNELARGEIAIQILAVRENVSPSCITRVVRLAFPAPDIFEAILAARRDIPGRRGLTHSRDPKVV